MLFDRKYVDITVFYLANSLWSVLWRCNSSCIMFFCVYFYFFFLFYFFLFAASFDGLRPLLVACYFQPFCSLASKLRSLIQGRCQRMDPPCKYLHPPQHLKEQLLQNGRNNLLLKSYQRIHCLPPTAAFVPVVRCWLLGDLRRIDFIM